MARLNSDAREILCQMVAERASEKREALVAELDRIDASLENDYKKRLACASKKLAGIIDHASEEVDKVLATYGLQWGKRYRSGVYNIGSVVGDDGKLKPNPGDYIEPIKETVTSKRRDGLKEDINQLAAKVAKAEQEILLRASLGMKYDEVVAIVNGFEF